MDKKNYFRVITSQILKQLYSIGVIQLTIHTKFIRKKLSSIHAYYILK